MGICRSYLAAEAQSRTVQLMTMMLLLLQTRAEESQGGAGTGWGSCLLKEDQSLMRGIRGTSCGYVQHEG